MSEESFMQNTRVYAARHQLQLAERLGFGIHGIIYVAKNKSNGGKTAVKAHREREPYYRERAVYERLRDTHTIQILGFNVPQFLGADDNLQVVEMTIVTRLFVLDFAGPYLDAPPKFTEPERFSWKNGSIRLRRVICGVAPQISPHHLLSPEGEHEWWDEADGATPSAARGTRALHKSACIVPAEEIWADWELEKHEQFDARWPTGRRVLAALEDLDIYVVDVSPRNISFCD